MADTDKGFLVNLSHAEKKALRILAAIEQVSMGEFTRESIRAKWSVRFPNYPLGNPPTDHKSKGKQDDDEGEE